jgi:hypothetical protein
MAVASHPPVPRVRPRDVLLVGAFVVGWSVGKAIADAPGIEHVPVPEATFVPLPPTPEPAPAPARFVRRPVRLALVGIAAAFVVAAVGLASRPDIASAPLVAPDVAARELALAAKHAEAARVTKLRSLELSGIAGRRVGLPAPAKPKAVLPPLPVVKPSERAIALDTYIQALGTDTILRGLEASRSELEQQVLHDSRVHIYPGGIGDVESGKVDVRILAMIEYLAQANGEVTVTCLISGHSYYVHGRPGVVSAHVYGRAVDIGAVAGISIIGNQGPGTITERAIKQILALPESVMPKQVISLMTLGGPSFALQDHYNHIHIGY